MIADLKPYPAMKNSGVPWLGEVPEHWDLIPNRALVRRRKTLVGDRHENYKLLSLTKQGLIVRDLTNLKGKFSADMGTSQEVHPGDLVFCLFDVPETPRTVGLSQHYGMITGAYTVFESLGKCSERFFELFYIAMDDRKLLSPLYSGLRNTIPPSVFLQTKTPVPSVSEQTAIVRYLDHANRRIQHLIRSKQKLIKLLEEHKQVIIHQAVTGQIDVRTGKPYLRYKPSGVEWLGEVPEHWEVKRLKHLLQVNGLIRGPFGSALRAQYFVSKGYKVYEQKNAIYDDCTLGNSFIDERKFLELKRFSVKSGDIIMSCSGTIGRVSIIPDTFEEGVINQALLVMRLKEDVHKPFFEHLFRSDGIQNSISDKSQGSAMKNLVGMNIFKNIALVLPSLDEQRSIADYLTENKKRTLELIEVIKGQIELLKEYKVALIANVVTGKLDVCEAAAQLPKEVEEMGDINEEDDYTDDDSEKLDDLEGILEEVEI